MSSSDERNPWKASVCLAGVLDLCFYSGLILSTVQCNYSMQYSAQYNVQYSAQSTVQYSAQCTVQCSAYLARGGPAWQPHRLPVITPVQDDYSRMVPESTVLMHYLPYLTVQY
jgi:hypothetical protein